MKNEVKKKMMIDSRKSRHQSHDEIILSTNVNLFLQEMSTRFRIATSRIDHREQFPTERDVKTCASRNRDGDNSRGLDCSQPSRLLIYNEEAKSREEPDSWPLLTMLSSSPVAAPR
jgi:hypothetical protein